MLSLHSIEFDRFLTMAPCNKRLDHIVKAFAIFGDRMKAIELCVNRFDDETKQEFMELYDKVDADVEFTPVDDTPQS